MSIKKQKGICEKLVTIDNELTGNWNWENAKKELFSKFNLKMNKPYLTLQNFEDLFYANEDEAYNLLELGISLINEEELD